MDIPPSRPHLESVHIKILSTEVIATLSDTKTLSSSHNILKPALLLLLAAMTHK